jgi:DNA/RNA-binding domain of Phe-tRNA-synthetase-like protein
MADRSRLQTWLGAAWVDPAVFALRPDYRVLLVSAEGLVPGPTDEMSHGLLTRAEASARELLLARPPEDEPHVAAWRGAYRAFGAKPQRTRNSLEALLRRVDAGLPRVNRLTDVYNAVSVMHLVPVGGEDLLRYAGAPRLVRAEGSESFDTVADGTSVVEHPEPGEVVWRDDIGVTCRRWNWRQGMRTRLDEGTSSALFVLDALAPLSDEALTACGRDLTTQLKALGPSATVAQRLITAADRSPRQGE